MPYNFVTDGVHTKKICSRLPSREVYNVLSFWARLWGALEAMYAVYLGLTGEVHSGLPVSVTWTFSPGFTSEALWAKTD